MGCPRDDQNGRLLAGVAQPARVTVSENSLGSPCVGGMLSSSNITDIVVTNAPKLFGGGPPSVPSRISVVLVDEAKAGATPLGRICVVLHSGLHLKWTVRGQRLHSVTDGGGVSRYGCFGS